MARNDTDSSLGRLEVTPEEVFFDRRRFLQLGATTAASLGVGAVGMRCAQGQEELTPDQQVKALTPPLQRPDVFPATVNEGISLPDSIPRKGLTSRTVAGTHNNYYEFLPGRGGPVWRFVDDFEVDPWTVEVTGLCGKPQTFDLDDLFKFEHEERVYHFRCVERWAMNVPWTGFPLRKLLEKVDPQAKATHVRFVTANRPKQMPGMREAEYYDWPYFEGLRIDEAMNDLAMVVTGVYGKPLLKQHGAPLRIIVPWKYGYKSPKSIVKIELLDKEPKTFWQIQPHEYGFLSNVNPNLPHPRWSQAESYWLDNKERFATPLFNGYAKQVAALYPDEPTTPQKALRPGEIAR